MRNQKFILGLFFILSASSANAQFDLIAFAGNTVVQVAESAVLGVCFVTNLDKSDVRDAFFAAIFSSDNPNVTQCTLGCAVTGLYEGKAIVKQFTGTDLTEFVENIVGTDVYSSVDYCFNVTKNAKCTFFSSYSSCIVPEIISIIQKDIKGVLTSVLTQVKSAISGILSSVGTSIPILQPFIQPIQQLLDVFFNIASTFIQTTLSSQVTTTAASNDWNPFAIFDILFPKATTTVATVKSSNTTDTAVSSVVTTTQKSNKDPISSFFDGVFSIIG